MRGNRVEEGFEVSTTDWRSKVEQALTAAKSADLARINVVAPAPDLTGLEELTASTTIDVAILDLRPFLNFLLSALRKPGREAALIRLYELTERNQPSPERVNRLVDLLRRHALTA